MSSLLNRAKRLSIQIDNTQYNKHAQRVLNKFRTGINKSVQLPKNFKQKLQNNSDIRVYTQVKNGPNLKIQKHNSNINMNSYQIENQNNKNNNLRYQSQVKSEQGKFINELIIKQNERTSLKEEPGKNIQASMNNGLQLKQVEQKLDKLIKQKINNLIQNNKGKKQFNIKRNNKGQSILDKKLQQLIQIIKKKRYNKKNQLENWKDLDKKILLIQKIIAQGATQLQIMKNYFAMFSFGRTSYKDLSMKNNRHDLLRKKLSESRQLNQYSKKNLHNREPLSSSKFKLTTLNKSVYQTPNQNDYQKYRYQHPEYKFSDIYVPKSSYKRSYLEYPQLKNCKQKSAKAEDSIKNWNLNYKQGSKYRQEFIQKRVKTDNYRQLDCYKDKYRDINVSYNDLVGNGGRKSIQMNRDTSIIQMQKQLTNKMQLNTIRIQRNHNLQGLAQAQASTTKIEFELINDKEKQILIKNHPKNKRLDSMKYLYKQLLNQ